MTTTPTRMTWTAVLAAVTLLSATTCRTPAGDETSKSAAETGATTKLPMAVTSQGVGNLTVGESIPPNYLDDDGPARLTHEYQVVADGRPLDVFRFAEHPVFVVLETGPFTEWFEDPNRSGGMDNKPSDSKLAEDAREMVRYGTPIGFIVVHGPGPATDMGIEVGDSMSQLEERHSDVELKRLPPMFGNDRCLARTAETPGIYYYFAACDGARNGEPITRIVVLGSDGRWP